jgi:N-acetylmuramoyl-L-alanine amidase
MVKIFIDRAHGMNVQGKQSPDGKFQEWAWSNKACDFVVNELKLMGYNVEKYPLDVLEFTDSRGNIWLSKRVQKYNADCSFSDVYVFSLHVNAVAGGWNNQVSGCEIWAQKENSESKRIAEFWGAQFQKKYPSIRLRRQLKGCNYKVWNMPENKFTILEGNEKIKPKYNACLIESGFMTNESDLKWLTDDEVMEKYFKFLANTIDAAIKNRPK